MANQQPPSAPINITASNHSRRHSSSIGSLSMLPGMTSMGSFKGVSVQDDGSISPNNAKLNFNSWTDRAFSPPGPAPFFAGKRASFSHNPATIQEPRPVNKALTTVADSNNRPASPMGNAILKGQFLD